MLFEEPDSSALLAAARARKLMLTTGLEAMLSPEEQIEQNNPERLHALCEALAQVADGLSFVHARSLLHRDVKPSNILVTAGRPGHPGGLRARQGFSSTIRSPTTARVVGTYRYMSPEQARGERLDSRSDTNPYAVGVSTSTRLLAGRAPFAQPNQYELLKSHHPPRAARHPEDQSAGALAVGRPHAPAVGRSATERRPGVGSGGVGHPCAPSAAAWPATPTHLFVRPPAEDRT